jgi:hypothetical protein
MSIPNVFTDKLKAVKEHVFYDKSRVEMKASIERLNNNNDDNDESKIFDIIKNKGIPISENVYLETWIESNGKIKNWTH